MVAGPETFFLPTQGDLRHQGGAHLPALDDNEMRERDWGEVRPLLHSCLHFRDGRVQLRGRTQVLRHLAARSTPKTPTEAEIRDGQLYRWIRG